MSDSELNDFSMLGLFRLEAENQALELSNGLMKLEDSPSDAKLLESLMRAAHSLKGAARIVQLDIVVTLTHAMEDCFVAAQEGKVLLNETHIDRLLEGVDLIEKMSKLEESQLNDFLSDSKAEISRISAIYEQIKTGQQIDENTAQSPASSEQSDLQAVADKSPDSQVQEIETEKITPDDSIKGSFVRVTSEKLNCLLSLAAESLVDVKQINLFEKKIAGIKKDFTELSQEITSLYERLLEEKISSNTREHISSIRQQSNGFYNSLSQYLTDFAAFSLKYDHFSGKLYDEVVLCRMRPFEDGVKAFPRMVRDLSKKIGKKVNFEINGRKTDVDRDILEKLEAPLSHLIRNAMDHGLEAPEIRKSSGKSDTGNIKLSAFHWAGMLNIKLEDDGAGIDIEQLRQKIIEKGHTTAEVAQNMTESELLDFLFLPGFSTTSLVTEISGRGVGLDVVQNMVQEVRGVVNVETRQGHGTTFHLLLPITLSVISTLLVEIAGEPYAFPLIKIERLLKISKDDIKSLEGHQFLTYENSNTGLVSAREVLSFDTGELDKDDICVVVISDKINQYALVVDDFIEERNLVVRPLDERLGKIPNISATSVMEDGSPVLIIDVDDMARSIDKLLKSDNLHNLKASSVMDSRKKKRVLVIDDSITVREVEKNLLTNKGYEVETAVDGADGWNALRTSFYDIVITDVDMPRMNGFELVEKIKKHEKFRNIPVMIVSYKDREEDKIKGIDVGADYYLTKSSFHDNTLIDAVYNLIGEAEN
jgi:two-component system sensor histidine kinase and response regulator WspE